MLINMSKSKTTIAYKKDYDPDKNFERVPFLIAQPGGVKTTITVGVAKTKVLIFITECVDKLWQVKRTSTAFF